MVQPRTYRTECPTCQQKVVATQEAVSDVSPDKDFNILRHIIARCGICYQTLLLEQDEAIYSQMLFQGNAKCLWPTPARSISETIPDSLRREHQEARSCFKATAYTATVVMVRRTLEGLCAQHGVTSKPLFTALGDMERRGLIEGRLLEWAQELRVLGNEAAHFTGAAVSRQDAADAVALAEALLDYLYVFSAQFEKFKQRRRKKPEEEQTNATSAVPS